MKNEKLTKHIENLSKVVGVPISKENFKTLAEIELEGNRFAVKYCNGDIDSERYFTLENQLMSRVQDILGYPVKNIIFLNSDPRGYFLKIKDDYMREYRFKLETDWGGFGIVCPDWVQEIL
jgi:hypothetical protein